MILLRRWEVCSNVADGAGRGGLWSVGSGLYGMLAFVIVAVFVGGLMVGRTPEYLGKKIESYEIKMASIMILIPPILAVLERRLRWWLRRKSNIFQSGIHGFSEVLYAFIGKQQ